MKLLSHGQLNWLVDTWKVRLTQIDEADRHEVRQTLDVLFMHHITPYLQRPIGIPVRPQCDGGKRLYRKFSLAIQPRHLCDATRCDVV